MYFLMTGRVCLARARERAEIGMNNLTVYGMSRERECVCPCRAREKQKQILLRRIPHKHVFKHALLFPESLQAFSGKSCVFGTA